MLLAQRQIHIRGVEWKTAHNYSHLIFTDKDTALWRKDSVFNQWCWEIWILKCRMKLVPYVLFWKKQKALTVRLKNFNIICDPEVARGSGRGWASINKQTQGVQSRTPEDRKWEEQLTNGISRKRGKLLQQKEQQIEWRDSTQGMRKMCQSYLLRHCLCESLINKQSWC